MKLVPDNVVENGGNNAKELAFLRILEGFSGSRKGECCGDSLKLDSNAGGFGSLKLLHKVYLFIFCSQDGFLMFSWNCLVMCFCC